MNHPSEADIDTAILATLKRRNGCATYVVRNCLSDFGKGPHLTTPQVLYRLKKLEKASKVERVPSSYAVMICWRVKE